MYRTMCTVCILLDKLKLIDFAIYKLFYKLNYYKCIQTDK